MTFRSQVLAVAVVAMPAALHPRAARAAEPSCPPTTVETDAAFRGRWPDLLEQIQSELMARADIDACAHVALRFQDDSVIRVSVTLADGRAASRRVAQPDDVVPTLQALLLVPEPPTTSPARIRETSSAPAARLPANAPAPHRSAGLDDTRHAIHRQLPLVTTSRELGIELSIITGARIGDGQFGAGAGVLSFVEVQGWLMGFEGRIDSYQAVEGSDPDTALELAILAGRRFDVGGVALDFTAGPAVALKGFAVSQMEVRRVDAGAPELVPERQSDSSSGAVPRLLVGARLGFSPRSVFRGFVGIDGEVGPRQVASNADRPVAGLPGFSVGLALGATIGTP